MNRYIFILIFSFVFHYTLSSQELNCRLSVVNTAKTQNVDKQVFKSLESALNEFINNTKWSSDQFKQKEKIECNILINITKEVNNKRFEATATIQSSRPVYKSNYNTVIVNIIDKSFNFGYEEHQPLLFNENAFLNNITSLLAYYAYVILGYDYDSFSLNGGNPYFNKAQEILNNAQSSGFPGWKLDNKSMGKGNRYTLIDNLLNVDFEGLRKCTYKYHREGLDVLYDNIEKGRSEIIAALNMLKKVHNNRPNSMLMNLLFNAKSEEIINVLKKAKKENVTELLNFLIKADTQNANKYRQAIRN
jgi:hypothetical protein